MKLNTKSVLLSAAGLLMTVGNALASAAPGDIPEIGELNVSGSTTVDSITGNLGFLSGIGEWVLNYAVYIAIFIVLLTYIILLVRSSWARSQNKVNEAVETQTNQRGLFIDVILTMVGLVFVLAVFAPFVLGYF